MSMTMPVVYAVAITVLFLLWNVVGVGEFTVQYFLWNALWCLLGIVLAKAHDKTKDFIQYRRAYRRHVRMVERWKQRCRCLIWATTSRL